MRATRLASLSATLVLKVGSSPTLSTAGNHMDSEDYYCGQAHPKNEKGIRSSTVMAEPNTAVYEAFVPWTYFQPLKVDVEKMAAPEKQYYQRLTRRPWDISTQEFRDIQNRKRFNNIFWLMCVVMFMNYGMTKEKKFGGKTDVSSDGTWVMLPKNRPELF